MNRKILCIDGEEDLLSCIEYILEDEGFQVQTLTSPKNILTTIADFHPDLILMEINFPGVDGLNVCSNLSQDPLTKGLPVILMSSDERIHLAGRYGAVDFIDKPFDIDKLISKVNRCLSVKELSLDTL